MMATVTVLTPANLDLLGDCYVALMAGFRQEFQCPAIKNDGLPDRTWVEACVVEEDPRNEVAVATEGLLIVHLHDDRRIIWMCPNEFTEQGWGRCGAVFGPWAHVRYGMAWFPRPENDLVTAAICAGDPGWVASDTEMRWSPQ